MLQIKAGMTCGAILLVVVSACSEAPAPPPTLRPATTSQGAVPVTVRQLIDNSEKYSGQTVSLTGKIILECPEGCWFFLDDTTGKIYVDLKPAGLTIPQKVGSRVTLLGKPKGSGGNLQVLGDEVKFLDEQ
jgi:uncharacterized protein YdeI (BOF family)